MQLDQSSGCYFKHFGYFIQCICVEYYSNKVKVYDLEMLELCAIFMTKYNYPWISKFETQLLLFGLLLLLHYFYLQNILIKYCVVLILFST